MSIPAESKDPVILCPAKRFILSWQRSMCSIFGEFALGRSRVWALVDFRLFSVVPETWDFDCWERSDCVLKKPIRFSDRQGLL